MVTLHFLSFVNCVHKVIIRFGWTDNGKSRISFFTRKLLERRGLRTVLKM